MDVDVDGNQSLQEIPPPLSPQVSWDRVFNSILPSPRPSNHAFSINDADWLDKAINPSDGAVQRSNLADPMPVGNWFRTPEGEAHNLWSSNQNLEASATFDRQFFMNLTSKCSVNLVLHYAAAVVFISQEAKPNRLNTYSGLPQALPLSGFRTIACNWPQDKCLYELPTGLCPTSFSNMPGDSYTTLSDKVLTSGNEEIVCGNNHTQGTLNGTGENEKPSEFVGSLARKCSDRIAPS